MTAVWRGRPSHEKMCVAVGVEQAARIPTLQQRLFLEKFRKEKLKWDSIEHSVEKRKLTSSLCCGIVGTANAVLLASSTNLDLGA